MVNKKQKWNGKIPTLENKITYYWVIIQKQTKYESPMEPRTIKNCDRTLAEINGVKLLYMPMKYMQVYYE